MKIGEYKVADYSAKQIKNDKKVEQNRSENISVASSENGLMSKNASFASDVKAINETMMSIELAGNSMQKISGDKMEEAVKDLRNITASLKEMLSKSFAATNENKDEYTVDALKAKLQGTNPSNLHDFDYLATKASSLLA